jgi:GT2 family glycosyltransferase
MWRELARSSTPHHQTLELLSAQALAAGDHAAAFRLADRRCRIAPLVEPHCFVLRADALRHMGQKQRARADILRALEIAPDDIAANRRLMAWGDAAQQRDAAGSLIAHDHGPEIQRQAIKVLHANGACAVASARLVGQTVRGWAVWPRRGAVEIATDDGTRSEASTLAADAAHPLRHALGRAADFVLPLPRAAHSWTISLRYEGETLLTINIPPSHEHPRRAVTTGQILHLPVRQPGAIQYLQVTVVVPIYGDYAATRACLDSLLAQSPGRTRCRIILVNDASPDAAINQYLAALQRPAHVELLVNQTNLGFVGSINRALATITAGDILLLNADTIVPDGVVERLAAAAYGAPCIGTVTPLSNNGEFTSFPLANKSNPLPTVAEIAAIDRVAANANADQIVDIPNGIGFCLYVTRACLDTVGMLSTRYARGYLEDVDFCLRARERGFRNVCATAIYVGHAGSRSFGREKRSLVVRNLALIEHKFPSYRAACAAFVALDPLRPFRDAIERAAPLPQPVACLLVTGEGALSAVAHERARHLSAEGEQVLVLELHCTHTGVTARITNASDAAPQSLAFQLAKPEQVTALLAYVRTTRPSRLEIVDLTNVPRMLLEPLTELGSPFDILIADAALAGANGRLRLLPPNAAPGAGRDGVVMPFAQLRQLIKLADRLLAPCVQAAAFATQHLPQEALARLEVLAPAPPRPRMAASGPALSHPATGRLGIIPIECTVQAQWLIRDIAIKVKRHFPATSLVVLGETLDDLALMRIPDTFVTGPLEPDELGAACELHGVEKLFLFMSRPLFGHPRQSRALASGLSVAWFDWSGGALVGRPGDLLLDPYADPNQLIAMLADWLGSN